MKQLLELIKPKPQERPTISVQTMKLRSSVYPEKKLEINDWYKHIYMSADKQRKG